MAGLREEAFGQVIDRFYEAAMQPELWRAVLHEASLAFGAGGANLYPGPSALFRPVCSESLDEPFELGVREGWFASNPRVARLAPILAQPRFIATESMLFSPEELDRLPFNAEFVDRFGYRWCAIMPLAPAGTSGVFLSVERRKEQGMFSQREIAALWEILPHLQRAGQLASHLAEARATGMLEAFDRMGAGGILIDAQGRALRLNSSVRPHIGRGLTIERGQVCASYGGADPALQALIGSAVQADPAHEAPPRDAVVLPRPGQGPLIVHAAPIVGSAQDVFQRARAILVLVDPDRRREPGECTLHRAFGLSPAEARIALGLAHGQDLAEIATAQGITTATARKQLQSVLAKTGTHRQAELVALVMRLADRLR